MFFRQFVLGELVSEVLVDGNDAARSLEIGTISGRVFK